MKDESNNNEIDKIVTYAEIALISLQQMKKEITPQSLIAEIKFQYARYNVNQAKKMKKVLKE